MKLKYALSMVLLALVSAFRLGAREEICNAVPLHPLPDGHETVTLEAAVATKYLLLAKGTASQSAILCTATLIPLGPTPDEGAIGDKVSVALLGATSGTVAMVASKAIAENTNVYATAAGKVTDAVVSNAYWVGKTAPGSLAGADGDVISVIPRFPRINP
jgi:hypothetical protein